MTKTKIPELEVKPKSLAVESSLENLSQKAFGRSRQDFVCVICGSTKVTIDDFKNEIARREFQISRMCQECQDSVFDTIPFF